MRPFSQAIVANWEKSLFWCALAASLALLLAWWGPRRETPGASVANSLPPRHEIIASRAYAMLVSGPSETAMPGNPFHFAYQVPADQNSNSGGGKDGNGGGGKDGNGGGGKDGNGNGGGGKDGNGGGNGGDPPPPPPPPPPAPPKNLRFLGIYVSTGGERLAAIEIRDPVSGHVQTAFHRSGQTCEGLKLGGFDGDSLELLAPGGKRSRVWRGAEQNLSADRPE